MAVEQKRGCGFRKVGGLYLVAEPGDMSCHRLPYTLTICPTCGGGVKFSRGWTWINPMNLFGLCPEKNVLSLSKECHTIMCPMCFPPMELHGLMWVGSKYYSPDEFVKESNFLGVSKRISAVPKGFELGKTMVYLAHTKAGRAVDTEDKRQISFIDEEIACPGVFFVFTPSRIEKILRESDATKETVDKLAEKNITVVTVPDNDKDHIDDDEDE